MTGRGGAGPGSHRLQMRLPPERGHHRRLPPPPQHGRAALAPPGAAAAPPLARPGRRRAAGPGAGREGCGGWSHPNPGEAAGCAARGRAPARGCTEVPATPAPALPQGPHALLRQGCHQPSGDAAPIARSVS